jgi:hypothetical protein
MKNFQKQKRSALKINITLISKTNAKSSTEQEEKITK